ncbi:MAG: hypothetical protein IPO58_06385 [Betaproteobacteria bacterium]|nr:hypothetical protein [Betaproteobacteria bacterium]
MLPVMPGENIAAAAESFLVRTAKWLVSPAATAAPPRCGMALSSIHKMSGSARNTSNASFTRPAETSGGTSIAHAPVRVLVADRSENPAADSQPRKTSALTAASALPTLIRGINRRVWLACA